ncbi:MAG: hypothetical protein HZC41_16140 [Chloroflexi bacterium]|nr:hypothetical protein [Chloroflexota bacterium]
MNRKWLKISMVVAAIAVLAVTAVVAAAAWPGGGRGQGFGFGPENSMWSIVAEALGIEADALVTELQAGKSIAQIAEENDVAVDTVVEAIVAARTEDLTAAVEAGNLTQEQADAHLALLRANLNVLVNQTFDAPNFTDEDGDGLCDNCGGFGMGHGMMGPRGGFGMGRGMGRGFGQGMGPGRMWGTVPQATPEATAEPNA